MSAARERSLDMLAVVAVMVADRQARGLPVPFALGGQASTDQGPQRGLSCHGDTKVRRGHLSLVVSR